MPSQRLHSALAPIDVLTRVELETVLTAQFDQLLRTRYRGVDSIRFPVTTASGNGGTLNLGAITTADQPVGPSQGDIWLVRRANVTSNLFSIDSARYILFRGSTPSDPNGYSARQVLDGQSFQAAVTYSTMTAPSVPATTVAAQNTTNQAYTVVISGGTLTAVTVNGIIVGTAAGTYTVPAYGAISITYTVAPTWTWTATQLNIPFLVGQNQGLAYNPGSKSVILQPGEQIYAQVLNSSALAQYTLTGEAIRVPAEMKGKIL